jgi:hypothetical protein
VKRHLQLLVGLALAAVCAIVLPSCSPILSEMPTAVGGLPAGTPERPAGPTGPYPAVHDMPPPRSGKAVLTEDEKKKVEAELAAMRAEQEKRATDSVKPE